jgi:hypothetical protein
MVPELQKKGREDDWLCSENNLIVGCTTISL